MRGARGPVLSGLLTIGLVASLVAATPALAATVVVTFEDLAPGTVVSTQYQGSHGVVFNGPPSDGYRPVVTTVPAGTAHSGTRVTHFSTCPGCEFYTPRTVGRLTSTASRVEAYVGYLESEPNAAQAQITMIARDAGGQTVGTSATTVTEGQPFTQLVGVTAPGPTIASFELTTTPTLGNQPVGFDDLAITTPGGQPPDFSLEVGAAPVPSGTSVAVPIVVHRLNGSNGGVTLSASGLPPGVSASFQPTTVTGVGAAVTMRLTAEPKAAFADATITITGTPSAGAGTVARSVTLPIRSTPSCSSSVLEVRPVPGQLRVSSGPQLAEVLQTATNIRVVVPAGANWEMVDCTGEQARVVPLRSGVSLVGEASALGRRPRLWTRVIDDPDARSLPLFETYGDNVRLEGLHLDGPFKPKDHGSTGGPSAVAVFRDQSRAQGRIIITDNEIEGFRNAVDVAGLVQVRDPKDYDAAYEATYSVVCPGPCPRPDKSEAQRVRVEYNYLHNQARVGGGYGVVVGGAAYARITGNVFEYNNHSVAASGEAFSGYLASRNYILEGAIDHKDHHFDVHGTEDPGHWAGGDAGTFFEIDHNTVRGEQDYAAGFRTRNAFGLRGRPTQAALFHHNVLVHDDRDEALKLSEGDDNRLDDDRPSTFNLTYRDNKHDTDYTTEIAAGDFDGDGRTDVFLANGTAWFYSSGGIQPWRFIDSSSMRTKELAFADVDNDGVTDAIWRLGDGRLRYLKRYSSPAVALPSSPVPLKDLRFGDFDGDSRTDIFYTRNKEWNVWYGSTRAWTVVGGSVTPGQ